MGGIIESVFMESGIEGALVKTPERPISEIAQEAKAVLTKIEAEVKNIRHEDWKGPLDKANDNLKFATDLARDNPAVEEFFKRTGKAVNLAPDPESETQGASILRDLKVGPDKRVHLTFLLGAQGPSYYDVKQEEMKMDYKQWLLKVWKAGGSGKRQIKELAKLQYKDVIGKFMATVDKPL